MHTNMSTVYLLSEQMSVGGKFRVSYLVIKHEDIRHSGPVVQWGDKQEDVSCKGNSTN